MRYNEFLRTLETRMPNQKKRSARKPGRAGKKRAEQKSRPPAASAAKDASVPAAVLDARKLQGLYSSMLQCRALSAKLKELSAPANSAANHAVFGHEAILVGAAAHAVPGDSIVAAQHDLLAQFIQGASLETLRAHLSPENAAAANAANTPPAQPLLARSMTLAGDMKGSGKVAFVFCGENAAPGAAPYEALAAAARQKLPLVCLVEMNLQGLAEAEARSAAAAQDGTNMTSHFPRIAVDGTDVVAVFRVAQEAARRARGGHGPSMIQCVVPETEQKTRPGKNDPLAFMERYLRRRKLWSNEWRKKITGEFGQKLGAAFR